MKYERKWLKKIRLENEMSQEEFAKLLSLPTTTYASYEQGFRTPSVKKAKAIAKKLDVSWTYFFDQELLTSSN